jgi:diamine N-acetyltransferase
MPDKYSVTLAPVTEEDRALISHWASSNAGLYASGTKTHVSTLAVPRLMSAQPS